MGHLYHSSITTATMFHADDLNPPLSTIDKAISFAKNSLMSDGGDISWDSTAGTLSWSKPIVITVIDPDSGNMALNTLASGNITIPQSNYAYIDLSTANGATVSATYVAFSATATAIATALVPANRFVLGAVDTSLDFYSKGLSLPLRNILNSLSTFTGQHVIDSSAAHTSTATEGNIFIASSAGLPVDGSVALSGITSTIAALATAIGINQSSIAANSAAIAAISTHARQHVIDSSADHTSTAGSSEILIADANGLPVGSGRQLDSYRGARESSLTCAATFTIDFSTAETRFVMLTTNASAIVSGGSNGHLYRLRVQQDATGNWTLALGATANSIRWEGGTPPTITTSATVSDLIELLRSNGTWFGSIKQNF